MVEATLASGVVCRAVPKKASPKRAAPPKTQQSAPKGGKRAVPKSKKTSVLDNPVGHFDVILPKSKKTSSKRASPQIRKAAPKKAAPKTSKRAASKRAVITCAHLEALKVPGLPDLIHKVKTLSSVLKIRSSLTKLFAGLFCGTAGDQTACNHRHAYGVIVNEVITLASTCSFSFDQVRPSEEEMHLTATDSGGNDDIDGGASSGGNDDIDGGASSGAKSDDHNDDDNDDPRSGSIAQCANSLKNAYYDGRDVAKGARTAYKAAKATEGAGSCESMTTCESAAAGAELGLFDFFPAAACLLSSLGCASTVSDLASAPGDIQDNCCGSSGC